MCVHACVHVCMCMCVCVRVHVCACACSAELASEADFQKNYKKMVCREVRQRERALHWRPGIYRLSEMVYKLAVQQSRARGRADRRGDKKDPSVYCGLCCREHSQRIVHVMDP